MGVLVQIRDVPEGVHRTLKARAAQRGTSLSEYLRSELERVATAPTPDELLARLRTRRTVTPGESSADALRALRDERS
jgi:plasmid stability protein